MYSPSLTKQQSKVTSTRVTPPSCATQSTLFQMGLTSRDKEGFPHDPADLKYLGVLTLHKERGSSYSLPLYFKEAEEVNQASELMRAEWAKEESDPDELKVAKQNKDEANAVVQVRKGDIDACLKAHRIAKQGMSHTKQDHVEDIDNYVKWQDIRNACESLLSGYAAYLELRKNELRKNARKGKQKEPPSSVPLDGGDSSGMEPDVVLVETRGGVMEPLDDVFGGGGKSKLAKGLKHKKYTLKHPPRTAKKLERKVTTKMWDDMLARPWTHKDGSSVHSGSDKFNHGLSLSNEGTCSIVRCGVCGSDDVDWRKLGQHLATKCHTLALPTWREGRRLHQQNLEAVPAAHTRVATVGQSLTAETQVFRLMTLYTALRANKSMGQLKIERPFLLHLRGIDMGEPKDLNRIVGPILHEMLLSKVQELVKECYAQFGTTTDGSPSVASAEAVAIRLVRKKTLEVFDLLIHVGLYAKSLNADQLVHGILFAIRSKAQLDTKDWRTAMVDGASTNTCAIRTVAERTSSKPSRRRCSPHTFSIMGGHFDVPHAEQARQEWNSVIMHPGAATLHFHKLFGQMPQRSSGPRWWLRWMQSHQLTSIGLQKIITQLLPTCIAQGWSKASSEKLAGHEAIWIAFAIVEMAALADAGKAFVHATYQLEGNDPLILSAYRVFDRLDEIVNNGVQELPLVLTTECAENAAGLIGAERELQSAPIRILQEQFDAALGIVGGIEERLLELDPPASRSRRRRPERFRDDLSNEDEIVLQTLRYSLVDAEDDALIIRGQLDEAILTRNYWEEQATAKSKDDFIAHARKAVQPAFGYYTATFQTEAGDMNGVRMMCEAAKIFDPFFLKASSIATIELLVDLLKYYEYPEFDDSTFLEALKKEIEPAIADAKLLYDWESDKGSQQYTRRAARRKNRRNRQKSLSCSDTDTNNEDNNEDDEMLDDEDEAGTMNVEDTYDSWMDDPGERSRRILCWWQTRMVEVKTNKFPAFKTALRLVLLTQLSSAFVERVFSRLERATRGKPNIYEDTLNMRILLRTNGDRIKLFPFLHAP
jgi:hypothetical protein